MLEDALSMGLVDKLMTEEELYQYLADASATQSPFGANTKTKEVKLMTDTVITPEASAVENVNAEMEAKLAEMQAALEAQQTQLAAYEAKEKDAAKASLSAELDNSAFLAECKEDLLNFFMSAEVGEENKALMNSVISAANTQLSADAEAAQAKLEEVQAEANGKVEAAEKELNSVKADAEAVKEEFATTKFSETSETKELNVQLSREEQIAQAVAAEKAKTSK